MSEAVAIMRANGRKSREAAQRRSGSPARVAAVHRGDGKTLYFDRGQSEIGVAAESVLKPCEGDGQYEAVGSSCGDCKGRAPEIARPLRLQCSDCEVLLHELSNVVTGVLMNAQVLEWKLPPYSHMKRSIREVERNAQRGGELLKRLMRRLAPGEGMSEAADVSGAAIGAVPTCVSRELTGKRMGDTALDLTGDCDPRTSGVFPKRDDGDKR
ncbi:MAG: hypothetical protein ABR902_09265 [Candidatus Korobacteraceae bacterium]